MNVSLLKRPNPASNGVPPVCVREKRMRGRSAWRNASGTVKKWVYWLILFRPCWPSFESSLSRGMIGVINCMMIEAVM